MLKKISFNKSNLLEYYVMLFLFVGLPVVALIYSDWRGMITTFVLANIIVGILALKADTHKINESTEDAS